VCLTSLCAHLCGWLLQVPNLPDSGIPLSLLRRLYLPDLPDTYCAWDDARPRAYPPVRILPPHLQLRVLVSGGAGFVGSHLVDRLMLLGHQVIVADNFYTGTQCVYMYIRMCVRE
jgi:hypothetical protein